MALDWAALPPDVLGVIALKLEIFKDFITFLMVCRCWKHAWSLIKNQWRATPLVPWLLLVENTNNNNNNNNPSCVRKIFGIIDRCTLNFPTTFGERCWGSPYGWVAVAKHLTIQLFNPITKATIDFPSLETITDLHRYNPEYLKEDNCYHWILKNYLKKLVVLKVSHNEFVIILLSDFSDGGLAFARHGDESWTTILIKETRVMVYDVVTMDDHVFALYNNSAIAYWSVKEFYGAKVVKPMEYAPDQGVHEIFKHSYGDKRRVYLVQSGSDLVMVQRYTRLISPSRDLKAYKLDPKDKIWEEIKDLGDAALFLGDNYSMFISQAHLKCGLRSNGIYFSDQESPFRMIVAQFGGHFLAPFDIIRSSTLYKDLRNTRFSLCTPTWFIPHF